jgi:hypothetical protein
MTAVMRPPDFSKSRFIVKQKKPAVFAAGVLSIRVLEISRAPVAWSDGDDAARW